MKNKLVLLLFMLLTICGSSSVVSTKALAGVQKTGFSKSSPVYLTATSFCTIFAQEVIDKATPEVAVSEVTPTNSDSSTSFSDILKSILMCLLALAILAAFGHMCYIYWFLEKKILTHTVEEFEQLRASVDMSKEATMEENNSAAVLLQSIYENHMTKFFNENNEERGLPTNHAQMLEYRTILNQVESICPTDIDVVNEYNNYVQIFNDAQARIFDGSKLLIILAAILTGIMFFAGGIGATPFFLFSIAMYWLSTKKPTYMFYDRELKGKKPSQGLMNILLGGAFGMVAGATTYKTITEYSDGSKTEETDNSETWISMVIALIVSVILVTFMTVVGLVNYLRNYIIYK